MLRKLAQRQSARFHGLLGIARSSQVWGIHHISQSKITYTNLHRTYCIVTSGVDCSLNITSFNFNKEVVQWQSGLIIMILYSESLESKTFINNVKAEAAMHNETKGQLVRVALINCDREVQLARQFQVEQTGLPATYFLHKGNIYERTIGIMHQQQIISTTSLVLKNVMASETPVEKAGNDSAIELELKACKKALKEEKYDYARGKALKVVNDLSDQLVIFKASIGVGQRKISPEMMKKLKENIFAQQTLEALVVLTRCALALPARQGLEAAAELAQRIVTECPWALKDSLEVADVILRTQMLTIAQLTDSDTLDTLSISLSNPVCEYERYIKLAVLEYYGGNAEKCISVLLEAISAESKLGIKKSTDSSKSTLARKLIVQVFDALGNDSQLVKDGRKRLSMYLFC